MTSVETHGGSTRAVPRGAARRGPARLILDGVIVAVAMLAVGTLSLMLARETGLASPVWPAAGIAVGAVFLRGPWMLPAVFAGSLATNTVALIGDSALDSDAILVAASIAMGSTLGAWAASALALRVVGPRPALNGGREVLLFLLATAPVAGAIAATVGTSTQVVAGIISTMQAPLVWITWLVGDAIGIIVVLPLTIMFSPEQSAGWRGRRWKVAVPSIAVLFAVSFAVVQNAGLVLEQRSTAKQQEVTDAAAALKSELNTHAEALDAIVSMFKGSRDVSAAEFRTFTQSFLARHPDVQAVSWNPIVSNADRAAFVEHQRSQPGMANFEITEKTADGSVVPAAARDEYVTVGFIEPLATNRKAVGFDVSSNPVRAAAINRARTTGESSFTAPIELVQESGTQQGALMFIPSAGPNKEVNGFAVGVYRLGDLLAATLADPKWTDWNFELIDVTDAGNPQIIATRAAEADGPRPPDEDIARETFSVAGRTWSLEAWPTQAMLAAQQPATASMLLLGGLLISFLLEAFLLLLTGMEHRARRDADSSSFEAVHDELTGLINRRGFFRDLETVRDRIERDEATAVLMYLDLDGFKTVNDQAGHDAGDDVLRKVARAMQAVVRERDIVARLGGDEFAIIATDCDLHQAQRIAHDVQAAINACEVPVNGAAHGVGVSIGLAEFSGPHAPEVDSIVRSADEACYAAKRAGRGTIRTATSV